MRPSRQDHEASDTLRGALAFDQRRKLLVTNHRGVAADGSFNAQTGCAEPLLLSTRMFFLQNALLQQCASAGGSAFGRKLFLVGHVRHTEQILATHVAGHQAATAPVARYLPWPSPSSLCSQRGPTFGARLTPAGMKPKWTKVCMQKSHSRKPCSPYDRLDP